MAICLKMLIRLTKTSRLVSLALGILFVGGTLSEVLYRSGARPLPSLSPVLSAQTLPGDMQFFTQPPLLADSSTTFNEVSIPDAKYYFTIALPAGAGANLAQVVFQRQDSPDPIEFTVDQTEAFYGDRQQLGQSIPLNATVWNAETSQLTVSFATPITPGQTVTIRLKPVSNPDVPGVYQFRLFAYPSGSNPQSMDLGVARFQFYRGIN